MKLFVKDRSFYKTALAIGLPIAAQQLITSGVNMMDNVMVGKLGETSIAAAAAGTQVHFLFTILCTGIGVAGNVMVARFIGSGEKISMRKALSLTYRFCLGISILYTLVIGLFTRQVSGIMSSDAAVIEECIRYLRWSLPCYVLHSLATVSTVFLRSSKQMRIPLYCSIGAFFVNIFFNWVFIFGKFGAPAMGAAGAALGTTISRLFECAFCAGFLFFKDTKLNFRVKDIFAPCADLFPEFVRVCVPIIISDTLLGIGSTTVIAIGGHVGKTYMAAASVTTVVRQMTSVFTISLGQPAVIIIGGELGKGNKEKAYDEGVTFTALAFCIGIVFCLLLWILTPFIVGLYNIEPETVVMAKDLLHGLAILSIFMMPSAVLTKGVIRGGGDSRFLMFGDIGFLWLVSIPLGYAAGLVWHLAPFAIYFLLNMDHILKVMLCLWRLGSKKWMKKIKSAES